jgi:hypothetical protein
MREQSEYAKAAAAIRAELKKLFPTTKFSVRSCGFSMGDEVSISWTDGPLNKVVKTIVSKYQYGNFNSMEDFYENTNRREDIPQSKYVNTSRHLSNAKLTYLVEKWNESWADDWQIEIKNQPYIDGIYPEWKTRPNQYRSPMCCLLELEEKLAAQSSPEVQKAVDSVAIEDEERRRKEA